MDFVETNVFALIHFSLTPTKYNGTQLLASVFFLSSALTEVHTV